MSALGHSRTNRRGPKSIIVRSSPKADIGQRSRHSESAANLLTDNGSNFANFSEYALILQANWSDFDSAIRRFDSSRPSQLVQSPEIFYLNVARKPAVGGLVAIRAQSLGAKFDKSSAFCAECLCPFLA
jgi:hypothetical protein